MCLQPFHWIFWHEQPITTPTRHICLDLSQNVFALERNSDRVEWILPSCFILHRNSIYPLNGICIKNSKVSVPIYMLLRLASCHSVRFISPVPGRRPRQTCVSSPPSALHRFSQLHAQTGSWFSVASRTGSFKTSLDLFLLNLTITWWKLKLYFSAVLFCQLEILVFYSWRVNNAASIQEKNKKQ